MKIALVKRRYSLKAGGSERYCVMLARGMMAAGHRVTVIGHQIDEDLRGEVRFMPVPVSRWTSSTKNRSFAVNCGHAIKAGRFDVAYGLGRAFGLDAVRVTERLQSHWLHVYYKPGFSQRLQELNPRHRTLIELERRIYLAESTRRIVTQSKLDRELLMKYYQIPEEKIRTIYNGIDSKIFHPDVRSSREQIRQKFGLPQTAPLLVFASMDFEGKGLRTILQSLAQLPKLDLHLLVLGTGPIHQFHNYARQLGVEKRVVFAGRQSDIANCYGAGDLFILPTEYEPFPNVNLEAMACGLPVLTTRTSGGADIISDCQNGYLIPTRNSLSEMTSALASYFELNDLERASMSRAAIETAGRFPIENTIQRTLEMLEELCHDRAGYSQTSSRIAA